ncbi:hypothetical protein B7463_g10183, partial [Scytalidium lignicola]
MRADIPIIIDMQAASGFGATSSSGSSTPISDTTAMSSLKALYYTQFEGLPPLNTPGNTPWSEYIRKVHTFTTQSLDMNDDPCDFCFFIRKIASIAQRCPIPSSAFPAIPSNNLSVSKPQDGDGFTLATTSSRFMLRTAGAASNLEDQAEALGATSSLDPASVWLLVIKGRNTLERVAYECESGWFSNIPRVYADIIRIPVVNSGTYIVEATDSAFNEGPLFRNILVQPDKIDYRLLQSWLTYCVDTHAGCQRPADTPNPYMKLIDCESHILVSAKPGMRYAALSYVWGQGPLEKYTYPSLPSDLPPTIVDSMTVALKMGMRYLWVDRYCVWQDDPAHKMTQVRAMEQIYRSALVTIVAASGSDPHYGLPGVSRSRLRKGQIIGRVGARVLVSGAIHQLQKDAFKNAKWNTRAWTFQESVLSQRLLIFTDYEVSFHCFEAECFEHLTHPISPEDNEEFRRGVEQKSSIQTPDGISKLIFKYTQRQMTYSSDALNAFSGVLSAWCAANANCYHLWGVPIRLPRPPQECTKDQLLEALWGGLCWNISDSVFRKGSTREGFPSWSWLGVDAGIQLSTWWTPKKNIALDSDVRILTPDNREVDWCDFVLTGGLSLPPSALAPRLCIEGWVFKVGPFLKRTDRKGQAYYIPDVDPQTGKVLQNNILEFISDLGTNSLSSLLTNQFEAISPSLNEGEGEVAIVFERDGNIVKRIGLLHLQVYMTEKSPGEITQPYMCNITQSFKPQKEAICFS